MAEKKKSVKEIEQDKVEKLMETVAWRAGYYRKNPHRYVSDVLGITLKWFQCIILWAMFNFNYLMYIAARGQGKSFLVAIYCVVRCVLYPGSKIVVTAGTLKQANEVLLKIQDELMPKSPILRTEIAKCNIGQNDATIMFWNGSWIKSRTSTENSRSARANTVICDEFRMLDKNILDSVIREFLKAPRNPGYLEKPEYKHLKERNKELYLSSAWYKSSWAYKKAQSYTVNFFDDTKKYFICGLPYQLSIREGLLIREQVSDQMSETDFDPISFLMENEALWFGDTDGGLFSFDQINKRRSVRNALFPLRFYDDKFKVPEYPNNGRRILSVDVALMGSSKTKKNDAAALYINDLSLADKTSYHSNFIYAETFEGLTTDQLGLIIMRYFYLYGCTDIVLDTNGIGLGVADYIVKNQYDGETGLTYTALTFCNSDEMAERCKVHDALKVVWSVKATAQFNNDICVLLRNGIQNGKINFLISELDADKEIKKIYKQFEKLSITEQIEIKKAYIETTLAEYELVKLKHYINGGNIKVYETSGMRKDRYSSIAYNYWCACQLEQDLKPKVEDTEQLIMQLTMRKAVYL